MPMDLAAMLRLLPGWLTGQVNPDDTRAIITDLYTIGKTQGNLFPYRWTNSSPPAAGSLLTDSWSMSATTLSVSETTDDGATLGFALLDSAAQRAIEIETATASLVATVTGASTDQGTWRTVPISPTSVTGTIPTNNTATTLAVLIVLS